MGELTPGKLDQDVARAAEALARWRAALAKDPEATLADPIAPYRYASGKGTFDALAEPGPAHEAPLREALRAWVRALLHARITLDLEREEIEARAERSAELHLEPPRRVSWREAVPQMLAARTPEEREQWLSSLAQRGPAIAAPARERAARRREADERLGISPGEESARLERAARRLLARTEDLYRDASRRVRVVTAADLLAPALARDAGEGWPARITARWLEETLRVLAFGKLALEPLPAPLGASSFARALGAFGRALRRAGPARSLPFSLARDPERADEHMWGWVFAALTTSRAFHRAALGLGARAAAAQARSLSLSALVTARVEAARHLLSSDRGFGDRAAFEEVTAAALGRPLPRELAGAWPAWSADRAGRWAGLVAASSTSRELVERFDVDWFKNPAAARHLRAVFSGPAERHVAAEELDASVDALARALEEALG
jgi:hypothetical protein